MNKYIEEGEKSFHKSKGRYINPYDSGSDQYNDFGRGWTQAQKRLSYQLLKRYKAELVELQQIERKSRNLSD